VEVEKQKTGRNTDEAMDDPSDRAENSCQDQKESETKRVKFTEKTEKTEKTKGTQKTSLQ
jgi:hypothetical protein